VEDLLRMYDGDPETFFANYKHPVRFGPEVVVKLAGVVVGKR
jgi:hypothetical protein